MTETKIKVRTEYHPVVLHTRPALEMDEEQFFEFCQLNRDWRIERSVEGDLEITPPTGGERTRPGVQPSGRPGRPLPPE